MNPTSISTSPPSCRPTGALSEEGRVRLVSGRGEPLFLAGWQEVLFIHFEADPATLQRIVPFQLDLLEGRAYFSLVAFTMYHLRPRFGGRLAAWPFRPFAVQKFLNVRTYVRHGNERSIYFITEWLSSWLNVRLGPLLYGLPYRHAKINYRHQPQTGLLSGTVQAEDNSDQFDYEARTTPGRSIEPCATDSLDEFLMERYTAYTAHGSTRRFFRIWHPPWPQMSVPISILNDSLLARTFPWFRQTCLIGANYSPGFGEVWMGRAHRIW